jgi:hypothetical protein
VGPTGKNVGYETDGKSREFTRPIIILKKCTHTLSWRFPPTAPKPTLPSPDRHGGRRASVRNALAAANIDSKRGVKKIIHLDADILAAIKKEASRVNFG